MTGYVKRCLGQASDSGPLNSSVSKLWVKHKLTYLSSVMCVCVRPLYANPVTYCIDVWLC